MVDTDRVFSLRQPSQSFVDEQIARARTLPLSYTAMFNTADGPLKTIAPPGYKVDHTRSQIGQGAGAFALAKAAMKLWRHFDLGWVHVANPGARIESGEIAAVQANALGLWSVNLSRILYVIDEPDRFGYGYGTTQLHVERGEERFLIEYDLNSQAVHYDLLAVSQPAHWLAWLGYPYTRRRQRKFAVESHRRMLQIAGGRIMAGSV